MEGDYSDTISPADLRRLASKVGSLEAQRKDVRLQLDAVEAALGEAKKAESLLENDFVDMERPVDLSLMSDSEYLATGSGGLGFLSRNTGVYTDVGPTGVPGSVFKMGYKNFKFQFEGLKKELGLINVDDPLDKPDEELSRDQKAMKKLKGDLAHLTLSNKAIWDRERARDERGEGIASPWFVLAPYYVLCFGLDVLFDGKPIDRFWFLETVARQPYFSYINCLHVYETLGFWRRSAEFRKVHFAEEWNEFHHLLIMESLGGDVSWGTRFLAQHSAIAYYVGLVFLWFVSPTLAYNFSELIEAHAVDTYAQFVDENEERLKKIPAPGIARHYYSGKDMYLFDEFQTAREAESRRPSVVTLYDTFCNIRDDEGEHVNTMHACQDGNSVVRSPNALLAVNVVSATAVALQIYLNTISEAVSADAAGAGVLSEAAEQIMSSDLLAGILDVLTFF